MRLYSNEFPERYIDIDVNYYCYPTIRFCLLDTDIPLSELIAKKSFCFRRFIFCSRFFKFYGYTFDVPKEYLHG